MRIWLIILMFLPLGLLGQTNYVGVNYNNGLGVFNSGLWTLNTLDIGLALKLKASSISVDSLTYNSSGDLVTYFNADTVILDGSSEVKIGNSIRIGNPLSGTIYQILDTLGSSDSLILEQAFTGSITDEFYWGGVNTWHDENGYGNHAIQTTAIYQPKLLWAETDSAKVNFDGVNDRMTILNQEMVGSNSSATFYSYINTKSSDRQNIYDNGAAGSADGYALEIFFANKFDFRIDDGIRTALLSAENVFINTDYKITNTLDRENNSMSIYVNGLFSNSTSETAASITSDRNFYLGSSSFNDRYFEGDIYDFFIYERALNNNESIAITR